MHTKRQKWTLIALLAIFFASFGAVRPAPAQTIDINIPTDACGRVMTDSANKRILSEPCTHKPEIPANKGGGGGGNDRFFDPVLVANTGGWAESVSADDVNKDGKMDLVVTTGQYNSPQSDNRIYVYLQGPNGQFTKTYSSTVTGIRPESMDVADLNGDNSLDIFVANSDGGTTGKGNVEIYWGPNWATRTISNTGDTPYAVGVMPIVSSGITKSMAISTNWNDTVLSAFTGSGTTLVGTSYIVPQSGWNQVSAGADLNGDGQLDAVVMWGQDYSTPAFSLFYGDGAGNLTAGPSFPKNNENPSAITIGDVTGDGRADVIKAYGGNAAKIAVYEQLTDGTISSSPIAIYPSKDIPESLSRGDVTCDGIPDLLATNAGWYAFSWWKAMPDGTLGAFVVESHQFYFSHIGPNGALLADVNGDDLDDYIVIDYNSEGVLVALQRPCVQQHGLYLPLLIKQ